MFNTIKDITEAIAEQEDAQSELRTRMEGDFDLWALAKYEPEDPAGNKQKGYQSYTSSAPRNFFDKVLDGLNQALLSIQIQLPEDASEKERRAASIGELFLFGALNAIDRKRAKMGLTPLRQSIGHFICLRGWYAVRTLVYLPKGGKDTAFNVASWDPLHVTGENGGSEPLWAAFKHTATKTQIQGEYGKDIKGKDAEVIDFTDKERNSVIIEGAWAKKPTAHNLGHVPVLMGPVGSMPPIQRSSGETSTLKYHGDSVYASSSGLYAPFNKHVSRLMDIHERAVVGSLTIHSKDGKKSLDKDPYQSYTEILLAEGETIESLPLPLLPPSTAAILGIISQDLQQSTLPFPLAYGGTQQGLSGRALGILSDATRSVFSPRTEAMARVYRWLCEELLSQYAQKGIKASEFTGFKDKGDKKQGEFFQVKVKPTDINPGWFLNVRVEPQMPRDEEAAIMNALAATSKRGPDDIPLVSKQTARENILQLRDPDAEEDKVLEEMGKALPPIVAANIAAALKRRGNDELAEQVMMLLRPPGAKQGGAPPLPPQLIEAIVRALVESGQPQLAKALLKALGAGPQAGPPQGVPPGEGGPLGPSPEAGMQPGPPPLRGGGPPMGGGMMGGQSPGQPGAGAGAEIMPQGMAEQV